MSWKRCEIGYKLVYFTNRKSHTSFWLISKLVTMNDLEPRMAVILRNFIQSGSFLKYVKRTEVRPTIFLRRECSRKILVFGIIWLMAASVCYFPPKSSPPPSFHYSFSWTTLCGHLSNRWALVFTYSVALNTAGSERIGKANCRFWKTWKCAEKQKVEDLN